MELVKVIFELAASELHSHSTETLWASPLNGNIFEIDNVPFYVYGISNGDMVNAVFKSEGLYVFDGIAVKGGHSTYRIFQTKMVTDVLFESTCQEIEKLGCSKESGGEGFYAVDVPPTANIRQVYELLERGESEGVWIFEEGDVGHAH